MFLFSSIGTYYINTKSIKLTPRHDPNAENAIVLSKPAPNKTNEVWTQKTILFYCITNLKKNLQVEVVIDPYLGSRLRAHQIEGVKFLWRAVARRSGAILADAMGLGKTLQSLTLLWTALKQSKHGSPLAKRAIIVTPTYHYFLIPKQFCFSILKSILFQN